MSLIDDARAGLGPTTTAPSTPPCRLCGCTPAAAVTFRSVTGLIRITRTRTEAGPFCRDCGIAAFRIMTARTLAGAWWGPVSFALAPVTLVRNGFGRRRVGALAPPRNPAKGRAPLRTGRPVYLRRQIAGLLAPIGLVAAIVLITLSTPGSGPASPSPGPCVALDTRYTGSIVSCDEPHDGRLVPGEALIDGTCNSYVDWTVVVNGATVCVAPGTN